MIPKYMYEDLQRKAKDLMIDRLDEVVNRAEKERAIEKSLLDKYQVEIYENIELSINKWEVRAVIDLGLQKRINAEFTAKVEVIDKLEKEVRARFEKQLQQWNMSLIRRINDGKYNIELPIFK